MELVDHLARLVSSRGVAWDCGCGSGQLSTALAERFGRVIATDASAKQLAEATPHPNVEYRVGRAEESGIEPGTVDLAVAAQAAHWFDLPAYYAEVRRVVRPGAALALVTYNTVRITPEIDAVVDDFYWNTLASYWPPERHHVDEAYRSLPFPFEEVAVPVVQMRQDRSFADLRGYIETWSAVWALSKREGRGPIEAFFERLRSVWGDEGLLRETRAPIVVRATLL